MTFTEKGHAPFPLDPRSLQGDLTRPYHLRVHRPSRRSFTDIPAGDPPVQSVEYPINLFDPIETNGLYSPRAASETLHEADTSPPLD